jgi:signal transduction histidine kinase
MKNWSISKKVWLSISFIVFIVVIGMILIIFFLYERLYIEKHIDQLMLQGEELATVYDQYGAADHFYERLQWTNDMSNADVRFTDDPMQLSSWAPFELHDNGNLINFEERQQLLEGETVIMIRTHPQFQQDILGIAIPLFEEGHLSGTVFLSMPLTEVEEPFLQVQKPLLISLIIVVLIIIFVGQKMINDLVKPLKEMKKVSAIMAAGDFTKRIDASNRRDELGQLAMSFNSLSSSLEKVEEDRRAFLANVSHELRTPLSYMKGYTEAVDEGVIDSKKGLSIIQKEANRLERLVNDLLDLAQLEGDSYPIQCEPIAFAQLINEVIEQFELIIAKKGLHLQCSLDEDVIIYGDYDRIEQVIRNLLDNAIKYTPRTKTIRLFLTAKDCNAELVIADEGIGIPQNDILAVTERFYRVDKARTRKNGGSGLGLAIVSEIIKKHGGLFNLSSTLGEGTTVKISLRMI